MTLTKQQCTEIISWMEIYGKTSVKNVYEPSGKYTNGINYNITSVPRNKDTQWIFDLMQNFLYSVYPDNKVSEVSSYFYINEFFKGGRFDKHIDKRRNCSWTEIVGATLNSDFEGGKLLTYNPNSELGKTAGELYRMDSKLLHEVTEVTSGTRYSFVCFIEHSFLGIKSELI